MSNTPSSLDAADLRARAATLHQDVHGALQEQFTATLGDLQQLRALLGDATTKLSQAFQTMIHQARAQGAAARTLREGGGDEAIGEIVALAEEITRGSTLVVQSLQFEDMSTQLLQHVDKRLAWLEGFARDAAPLQTAVSGNLVGLTHDEFAAVEQRLAEQRARMHAHKTVRQESLDEGDVELF